MRIIITFLFFLIGFSSLQAQVTVVPLESNPILEREAAKAEQQRIQRFKRNYGTEEGSPRTLDCGNVDGIYYSGETIYLVAGDSVELCLNISEFDTLKDVSADILYGSTVLLDDCITYFSNQGVVLGLTDTIRMDKCDSLGCQQFFYPVVVKRANDTIVMPAMELVQEAEMQFCTPALNLPGDVYGTSFKSCNDQMLGEVFNVLFQDSCFVYVASRFAEPDLICFEVCDEYCICDMYNFTFSTTPNSIDYPFVDDFSYDGPYPDRTEWLDDNVFINSTMAYQPPSVGVATFDGLDETGTPHGGGSGRSDYLTSNYFNLSAADTDLWLSFWMENKGLSYPSNPGDSIMVEFKNDIGNWINVISVDGEDFDNGDRPPFGFYKVPLDDGGNNNYLYNGFQFRFVNNGSRSSMQDTWHLDYVVLDQGEPDSSFQDVAFGSLPSDILGRYSSMPWWQFENFAEEELGLTTDFSYVNHFPMAVQADNESFVNHYDFSTGSNLNVEFTVNDSPTTLGPGGRLDATRTIPSVSIMELIDVLNSNFAGTEEPVKVERKYTLVSNIGQIGIEDVMRNDTVKLNTVFDNYYAYDDGTAEAAAKVNQGHEVAVRFTANEDDVLRAVQFHFPRYGVQSSSALFNIKVYIGTLDDTPEFVRNLIKPFFVDVVLDSLQGFTTYRLRDINGELAPLDIPAGDFYVAWEQASSNESPVHIGLDYNSPNAQPHQFLNNNIDWYSLEDQGAFMVRPVLGGVTPGETSVKEASVLSDWMQIYPNPAKDQLYFKINEGVADDYQIQLLTATGQLVYKEVLSSTVDISQLPQGMYFVKLTQLETNKVLTHKLIVVE